MKNGSETKGHGLRPCPFVSEPFFIHLAEMCRVEKHATMAIPSMEMDVQVNVSLKLVGNALDNLPTVHKSAETEILRNRNNAMMEIPIEVMVQA